MTKAKTINRLELTRRKFSRSSSSNGVDTPYEGVSELPPEPDIHGDVCPNCGRHTLIHESGCVKCLSCSWSACG